MQPQSTNYVRKYRIGELPDIMIKWKDIIDPFIELSFQDEQFSSQIFPLLSTDISIDVLSSLFNRSHQQSLYFQQSIIAAILSIIKHNNSLPSFNTYP